MLWRMPATSLSIDHIPFLVLYYLEVAKVVYTSPSVLQRTMYRYTGILLYRDWTLPHLLKKLHLREA